MNTPAPLPLTHITNLGRLGNAGDRVDFAADAAQRAAIASWSGVLSLEDFVVSADISKLGPTRFRVDYRLVADVTQACVVTLDPVRAHMERRFSRELHFVGNIRRTAKSGGEGESGGGMALDHNLDLGADDGPEDIESLHYDLAGPVLEEYSLALEPYPRCPGAQFAADQPGLPVRENPFAVLKGLKTQD
jgi:hypothetical protein